MKKIAKIQPWPPAAIKEFNKRRANRETERLDMMKNVLPSEELDPNDNQVHQIKVAIGVVHILDAAFKSAIEAWRLGWLDHIEDLSPSEDPSQNKEFQEKGAALVNNALGTVGILLGTIQATKPYSSLIGEKAKEASQIPSTVQDTWSSIREFLENIASLDVYREAQKIVRKAKDLKDESIKDWLSTFDEVSNYQSNLDDTIQIFSDETASQVLSIIGLSIEIDNAPSEDDKSVSPIFSNEVYIKDTIKPLVKELFGE